MKEFLKNILGINDIKPLETLIPIEMFDEKHSVFTAGKNKIRVYDLTPRVGLDESSANLIADSFSQCCFEGLTINLTLISMSDIDQEMELYVSRRKGDKLAQSRADFFKNSTRNKEATKGFCRWTMILSLTAEDLNLLKEKTHALISALESTGLHPKIINAKRLISLYHRIWKVVNPNITEPHYNPIETIAQQLSDAEISPLISKNEIQWNDDALSSRTFYAKSLPPTFSLSQTFCYLGDSLQKSFAIETPLMISFICQTPEQAKTQQNYAVSEVRWYRQGSSPMASFIPNIAETINEFSVLRESFQDGEKIVHQGLILTVFSPQKSINIYSDRLKQYFSTLQFKLAVAQYLQCPGFLCHLPGAIDNDWMSDFKDFGLTRTLLARQAAQFMPLQAEWNGSPEPQALLTNRQGGLCFFDPFDKGEHKGNFNISITGKSGAGKSNFMAYLVFERLLTGGQCFIIDVGYSYQKMGLRMNAQMVEFSKKSNISLNPFTQLRELSSEALLYLKPLISKMCFRKRDTTELEDSLIEKAIYHAWNQFQHNTSIANIAQSLASFEDDNGKQLSQAIYPFSHGVYSEYFNKPSTLSFDDDFIIFELEELKDKPELQEIVMLTLIFKIQGAMYNNRHRKKYLVADEAWQLLGGNNASASASFLENIARRIRKFNGSLIVGTQGLDDFFTNKCGEAIFYNSDWLISLGQKSDAIDRAVKKCPELSKCETALKSVRTLAGQYAEALVKSQAGHVVLRLHLNQSLLTLFSTDAVDFLEKNKKEEVYHE